MQISQKNPFAKLSDTLDAQLDILKTPEGLHHFNKHKSSTL